MDGERKAIRAWAVLSRTLKDEPFSLEKATMYPVSTDRNWLERTFPGRVALVEIRPLPAKDE